MPQRTTSNCISTGSMASLMSVCRKAGAEHPFLFAMNAGMYHEDFSPVGLFVEGGRELAPLNQARCARQFLHEAERRVLCRPGTAMPA